MLFLFFFLWSINVLLGQDNQDAVPTTLYIANAYTFQPEQGVEVYFELRQPNGQYFRVATHSTNAEGMVTVSLQPNLTYAIRSKKAAYYTQLTLLETKELTRTNKNRFNISLRPKSCYRLQGQVQGNLRDWKGGYLEMLNLATQQKQQLTIDAQGRYYACGKCGETYIFTPSSTHLIYQSDTIYLDPTQCQKAKNPLLTIHLQLKQASTEKSEEEENSLTVDDSLVVKGLTFEGKSQVLKEQGKKALDELVSLIKNNPDLLMEILIHTDSRKSERYNWLLAQKRGEVLREYIKKQDIPDDRYTIVPVGEARILNHCTNNKHCTVLQHAVNNRVEMVCHPLKETKK